MVKSGNFFQVDGSSSYFRGIVIFRYLGLLNEKEKEHEKYPIYLSFEPYAVSFYIHRMDSETSSHQNTLLFTLPLSSSQSINDELANTLINLHDKSFDFIEGEELTTYDDNYYFNLQAPKLNTTNNRTTFFRKLFLDFLYDFTHTDIFRQNKYYSEIETRLKENFLFSAIATKVEYYYIRDQYLLGLNEATTREVYAKMLVKAEKDWVDTLSADKADEFISSKSAWFEDIESEYKRIFFEDRKVQNKRFERQVWKHIVADLEKRENKKNTEDKERRAEDKIMLDNVAYWFSKRYDINTARKIVDEKNNEPFSNKQVSKIIKYFLFVGGAFTASLFSLFEKSMSFISMFFVYLMGALIVFWGIHGLSFIISKYWNSKSMTIINISALPRLLLGVCSGWFLCINNESLWKNNFDMNVFNAVCIFLILFILMFFFLYVKIYTGIIDKDRVKERVFYILTLGFRYSLVIGFLMNHFVAEKNLTHNPYFKAHFIENIKDSRYQEFIGTLKETEIEQIENEINTLSRSELYQRLNKVETKGVLGTNYLRHYVKYSFFGWNVFPNLLFLYSAIALFTGVFFQLIFQPNPVTEPL